MRKIIFIFLLLFSFSFVLADYTEIGTGDHLLGSGIWGESTLVDTFDAFGMSDGRFAPVVFDLDEDGTDDIFIINDGDLEVYNYNTLTAQLDFVDSLTVSKSIYDGNMSMPVIADIDIDGRNEIMVWHSNSLQSSPCGKSSNISVYNISNDALVLEYDMQIDRQNAESGCFSYAEIQCVSGEEAPCMFQGHSQIDATGALYIYDLYNRTAVWKRGGVSLNYETAAAAPEDFARTLCPNPHNSLVAANIGGLADVLPADDEIVGIYFAGDVDDIEAQGVFIRIYQQNSSGTGWTVYNEEFDDIMDLKNYGATSVCEQADDDLGEYGFYITNPVMADFDDKPSNGLELGFGFKVDDAEAKMYMYDKLLTTLDRLDDFPENSNLDAHIMGSAMLADVFTESGTKDLCIFNYALADSTIQLACGSKDWGSVFNVDESMTASLSLESRENITHSFNNFNSLTHAVNYEDTVLSSFSSGSSNVNEFMTPYGIVQFNSCGAEQWFSPTECSLSMLYEYQSGALSSIGNDFSGLNQEDILGVSSTAFWYFDDGFSNTNCDGQNCITEVSLSPCNGTTWLQNTSVSLTMKLEDVNDDNLAGRAVLYEGESNEQDSGWSINVSSGSTIPFSFVANTTTILSTLSLYARDTDDLSKVQNLSIPFTVSATSGFVNGECTSSFSLTPAGEDDPLTDPTATESTDSNSVQTGVETLAGFTGLSYEIMYLIIMLAIALGVWFYVDADAVTKVGVIVLAMVILIVIGARMGFLGMGLIVTIILGGAVSVAIWIRKLVMGSRG